MAPSTPSSSGRVLTGFPPGWGHSHRPRPHRFRTARDPTSSPRPPACPTPTSNRATTAWTRCWRPWSTASAKRDGGGSVQPGTGEFNFNVQGGLPYRGRQNNQTAQVGHRSARPPGGRRSPWWGAIWPLRRHVRICLRLHPGPVGQPPPRWTTSWWEGTPDEPARRMNQPPLLARLLDKVADLGAEADVANQDRAFSSKADKGELSEYKVTSSQQIGIRLIKEGRVGIAYSEALDGPPGCHGAGCSMPAASPRWTRTSASQCSRAGSPPTAPRSPARHHGGGREDRPGPRLESDMLALPT